VVQATELLGAPPLQAMTLDAASWDDLAASQTDPVIRKALEEIKKENAEVKTYSTKISTKIAKDPAAHEKKPKPSKKAKAIADAAGTAEDATVVDDPPTPPECAAGAAGESNTPAGETDGPGGNVPVAEPTTSGQQPAQTPSTTSQIGSETLVCLDCAMIQGQPHGKNRTCFGCGSASLTAAGTPEGAETARQNVLKRIGESDDAPTRVCWNCGQIQKASDAVVCEKCGSDALTLEKDLAAAKRVQAEITVAAKEATRA